MSGATLAAAASALALAAALSQLREAPVPAGLLAHGPGGGRPGPMQLLAGMRRHALGRHGLAGLLAWAVTGVVAGSGLACIAGAVAVIASVARDRRAQAARRRRREVAAPALARALADALRGGTSIRGALVAAAEDRSVPTELRRAVHAEAAGLAVGATVPGVLAGLAQEGGPALRLLCGAVALHLDAGGALSSELDRIARTAEAAQKVEEDRAAATAQARATVRVVAALPLLALGAAQLVSPRFLVQIAEHPIALGLLVLGLVLEVVAVIVARAIVRPSA